MSKLIHDSLLLTKFCRPRLSRELVNRPRLLDKLQLPSSLTLVVAPAGYGKTTLVNSWLETSPMPSTWLSIDEADNDFSTFVRYLIAAIQSRFPMVGAGTLRLLSIAASPSVMAVSHSLINDLSSIDQDFVLVLDDYHFIRTRAIHQLLTDLVRRPPPPLHLVLTARNDPALPLPGLRARGLVTELRASDLRFSQEEVKIFFRDVLHIDITDQDISILADKTEGWPASLKLAAIYFQHTGSSSLIGANRGGSNRYLVDYLINEVTAQLPADTVEFLKKTSFLDHLIGPLCDVIMGFEGSGKSQKQLEWLHRSDLFITQIENVPGWYRYHHLFRQFLFSELKLDLTSDELASLYLRAREWFESQGFLKEAISQAFASGDVKTAVGIFLRHRRDITNLDDWQILQQYLRMYPREIINSQPELKMTEALLFQVRNQYADMAAALTEVDSLLAQSRLSKADRVRLEGEIAGKRSVIAYFSDDFSQGVSLAKQALRKIPQEWWQPRLQARLYMSVCYQAQGDLTSALDVLFKTRESDFGAAYHARRIGSACYVLLMAADLPGVERAATQSLKLFVEAPSSSETFNWMQYYLGVVHYLRNDLKKAEQYFLPITQQPLQVHAACFLHSIAAMALIHQSRGNGEKAQEFAEVMLSYSLEMDAPFGVVAAALKAELDMREGNLDKAGRWADSYQMPEKSRLTYFYAAPITYIRVLLAQNTPASRKKAAQALARLKKSLTAEYQTRWLIKVHSLQSMLDYAEGNTAKALKELKKAIGLAEPGGFIRNFVDLGDSLKPLLEKLSKLGVSPDYVARILSAF
jgi:LuxR family maltose regulon positive regulatory protein